MPRNLSSFDGCHEGEHIIVAGLGPSVEGLRDPGRYTTIGVNDIARHFTPTYLVSADPYKKFHGDRRRYVENSGAKYHFRYQPNASGEDVPFIWEYDQKGQKMISCMRPKDAFFAKRLYMYLMTPFGALCLAARMGAKRIGMTGVDITRGHNMEKHRRGIGIQLGWMCERMAQLGIEMVNLGGGNWEGVPVATQDTMLPAGVRA